MEREWGVAGKENGFFRYSGENLCTDGRMKGPQEMKVGG